MTGLLWCLSIMQAKPLLLRPVIQILQLAVALLGTASADESPANVLPLKITKERSNQIEMTDAGNGEWQCKTTGPDPYFFIQTNGPAIDLKAQPILSFEYNSQVAIGSSLLFVGQILDASHLITVESLVKRNGWATASIDMTETLRPPSQPVTSLRLRLGQHAGIDARIRNVVARPRSPEEKALVTAKEARAVGDQLRTERLKKYLVTEFESQITSATIASSTIHFQGKTGTDIENLHLVEVPMWADVTDLKSTAFAMEVKFQPNANFVVAPQRFGEDGKDRILSGWVLAKKGVNGFEATSAMRYAEFAPALKPAEGDPRAALKGLGGCLVESPDMIELGVKSITLNIMLTHFVKPAGTPNCISYPYAGRTWNIDSGAIAGYDRMLKQAAERRCTVVAIILLPHSSQPEKGSWIADASDPDADSGCAYVMPNFTTQAGVEAYGAVMSFLAERYGKPNGEHGRIHHWILHNEINSGFYWTSAGRKSVVTYMDAYQKSMRLTKILVSQHDPLAKPLISLDHSWTDLPDPRSYAGKEMLELLSACSKKEGDYQWGIAFHPYAQDLREPKTWKDDKATFAMNTKIISFKNLEVLNAWAQLPQVCFQGNEPREIQLTEQGLNSPDYSEKSLLEQAAGMAYAWKKVQPLKTITAFHYHLWADDHSEGGLRLGLRKYGDDPQDPHGKKPIWHLFKALGTDQENEAAAFALPIIGIKDWSEVPYRGEIRQAQ